jgi:hypothetical protein
MNRGVAILLILVVFGCAVRRVSFYNYQVDYSELNISVSRSYQSFHIEISKLQPAKKLENIYQWDSRLVRFNDNLAGQAKCYDIDCSNVINVTDILNSGKTSILISYDLPESERGRVVEFVGGLTESGRAYSRKLEFKRDLITTPLRPAPFVNLQWQITSEGWQQSPDNQKLIFLSDDQNTKLYVDFVIRQDLSTGAVHVGHNPAVIIDRITMEAQGRMAEGNIFESNSGASFPFNYKAYDGAIVTIYMQGLPPLRLKVTQK